MNQIVRSVTPEIGYDEHGQLWHVRQEGTRRTSAMIGNPIGHICPLCGRGWETRTESIIDQFHHQASRRWLHESCFVRHLAFNEHMLWYNALVDARIRFDGLSEIKNEYGGAWNTPWYEVFVLSDGKNETSFNEPRIKLGRRKRVWSMELWAAEACATKCKMFPNLEALKDFEKEDVTKEIGQHRVLIHAWTEEKARENLKVFARALGINPR